jgi:uncharacterized membrane protein
LENKVLFRQPLSGCASILTGLSFIKKVSESLSPGDSAIFIYIREDTPDDVLESMKEYKGKIHYTSLPAEAEEQLRSVMAGLDGKPVDLSE